MIKCCPNCRARSDAAQRFYSKQGYYITKHNHQPVPRYKCRACKVNFSGRSFSAVYRQHKPFLNRPVYEALISGMTFRRSARFFRVSRNTVVRKFHWAAGIAKRAHVRAMRQRAGSMRTIEFDEMESFQASRLNMLSISMAVQDKSGFIVDARVALMRPKGMLARKYPRARLRWNRDTRREASAAVLRRVRRLCSGVATLRCDGKSQYRSLIRAHIPHATLERCQREKGHPENWRVTNYFNHVAAKVRADLARMRRRTWACTRKWQNLQKHLYLYMAWNNGYQLFG